MVYVCPVVQTCLQVWPESRIHASVYKGYFETTDIAIFVAYKVEILLIVRTQFLAQLVSDYGQDHVFITFQLPNNMYKSQITL